MKKLICTFTVLMCCMLGANATSVVSNESLGKFIERQRKEIRELSPKLSDKQRKILLAHIEHYGDEAKDR